MFPNIADVGRLQRSRPHLQGKQQGIKYDNPKTQNSSFLTAWFGKYIALASSELTNAVLLAGQMAQKRSQIAKMQFNGFRRKGMQVIGRQLEDRWSKW